MTNFPPSAPPPLPPQMPAGPPGMPREQLRRIASLHRTICICILVYLVTAVMLGVYRGQQQRAEASNAPETETPAHVMVAGMVYIAVVIIAAVCAFMLAIQLHGTALGVVMGLLTLAPCLGLLILLMLSTRATGILKRHSIRVGLLGANPNHI